MSYTVLARKWRPKKFSELVGQTHVMQALANALDQQRLHHAYLFTGTRGVGKTTIARIFSKALNCEEGISSTPCGVCDTCRSIDEGRFIDLIEVDAASKTKVDDTREILDNVQFAPTQGRYKVYLIDEVHMLSKSSFNALLKTLEEPPEHVKFLLATTDPHKLPITVLSRCLQFNLMRLTPLQIQTHLEFIMQQESLPFESSALALIAKGADGSARDALSLLDQAIAYGAGEVLFEPVQTMLGLVDQQYSLAILQALAANDPQLVKQAVQQLASMGVDYQALLSQLIETLHALSYYQVFGDNAASMNVPDEVLIELAGQISPERVQLLYQIALLAKQDMQLAPDIRIGFEMALIRMLAFQPASNGFVIATENSTEGQLKSVGTANHSQLSTMGQPSSQNLAGDLNQPSSVASKVTATSEAADVQNALAGLATARSLVGKKVVPRTDFIKEEPTAHYSDQDSLTEADRNEPEQASLMNNDSHTSEEVLSIAQNLEGKSNVGAPEQFVAPATDFNPLSEPNSIPNFVDDSAPPWDQNDPGQMDENYPEGYFGEPSAEPFSEQVVEPFAPTTTQVRGVQPDVQSNISNNAPQTSSSDHLAKIKERLKQPLGKPNKTGSSQAGFSQDLLPDKTLAQSNYAEISSDQALRYESEHQSEQATSSLSMLSSVKSPALTNDNQSSVMSALNQLQAMQQSSSNVNRSSPSLIQDAESVRDNPVVDDNTRQCWDGSTETQVESVLSNVIENEPADVFGEIRYDSDIENWLEIIKQLSLKGMAAEIARNSVLVEFSEIYMAVSVDPVQDYSNQDVAFGQFAEAVKTRFGESLVLEFVTVSEHFTPAKHAHKLTADKQAQAVQSIDQDVVVQAFSQQLGMQIIPDSIQPI